MRSRRLKARDCAKGRLRFGGARARAGRVKRFASPLPMTCRRAGTPTVIYGGVVTRQIPSLYSAVWAARCTIAASADSSRGPSDHDIGCGNPTTRRRSVTFCVSRVTACEQQVTGLALRGPAVNVARRDVRANVKGWLRIWDCRSHYLDSDMLPILGIGDFTQLLCRSCCAHRRAHRQVTRAPLMKDGDHPDARGRPCREATLGQQQSRDRAARERAEDR